LPFADAQFDGVIANHMLYHVPDLPRGLAEIRRVLKPGGILFAATNGNGHMGEMHELLHRFDPQFTVTPFRLGFSLENGAALLAPYFVAVELRRYESSLRVTESAALVAYARSMNMFQPGAEPAFQALLEEELHSHGGVIEINKVTGLFRAVKAGER
jgi:SAM-dependent methyltransferase